MNKNKIATLLSLSAIFACAATNAFAGIQTGLPWESPLQTIRNSLSGPVAMSISIIAVVICGAMLIWGAELSDFARKLIMLVLVIALVVAANSILTILFGATGALL